MITPEDFTEEQRMIGETTKDFIEGEILPQDEAIESLNYDLTVKLLQKAGELGLLSADVPEQYEGLGLDKISSTLISERLSKASSFGLSLGAHVGIGTLPIVYFGTEEQKKKYLPLLASGEKNCRLLPNRAILWFGRAWCQNNRHIIGGWEALYFKWDKAVYYERGFC